MAEETKTQTNTVAEAGAPAVAGAPVANKPFDNRNQGFRGGNRGGKNPRKNFGRAPRAKPEFDQKIINIRRVTRVVAGGRRFNFSVAIVVGDRKGKVGVGLGKGGDTALAIDKAVRSAKKNMVKITTTKTMSIPHQVDAKYSSARVVLRPAKGRGIVAGSSLRDVIELAGLKDIGAKILSPSKNKLNIAQATIKALSFLKVRTPKAGEKVAPAVVKESVKAK